MIAGVRVAPGSVLEAARRAGEAAGVTRLAELTRLDRIGLPVWQAVRPLSRALSVHQGKGPTDEAAQIGALLEALESHLAETFAGEGPLCPWTVLPSEARADIADFADDRALPSDPEAPVGWVEATTLDGGSLYLPFDLISLDLTRALDTRFDRSSNGVATHTSLETSLLRALCELVERDAVTEWRAQGLFACMADRIDIFTVPFDWFGALDERLRAAGVWLDCYRVPAIGGAPVFVCETVDNGKEGAVYWAAWGSGCDPDPETALFRAVAEALQSRLSFIAGAREDFPPSIYAETGNVTLAFALPLPPGWTGLDWQDIAQAPADIPAGIAAAGYRRIAWIELGRVAGFVTVRAFVPGLGGLTRRRRAPS